MNHNKSETEMLLKALDATSLALQAIQVVRREAILKSAAPSYSYTYTYQMDLGQGRVRNFHLTFALNPQTGELSLTNESVSDSDS